MQVARISEGASDGPAAPPEDDPVNILIVDDLPEKLLVFETVLEDLGENLVKVQSGAAALREILKREFAVILLDVNMPDIDGFETAALIRKHRRSALTPIIFITSYADEVQTARGYSLGAVDYILSPVVPEVLRSKVGVFVSLYRMNRQIQRQADSRAAVLAAEAARQIAEENDKRSAFLANASRVLSGSLEVEVAMEQCAALLIPEIAGFALVQLTDSDFGQPQALVAAAGSAGLALARQPDEALAPPLREIVRKVVASRQRQHVAELRMGPDGGPGEGPAQRFHAVIGVPVLAGERVLGAIVVASDHPGPWNARLSVLLDEIASRAANGFENARLYRVLQRAQEELQESNRRKDEFLAMMSHELRNPLAPIKLAVEVVRRCVSGHAKVNWALDIADRQLRQMTRLIEELLDVTRISQGKIVLKRERVDLNAVIAQSVETVHGLIESRRQRLSVDAPAQSVWLEGDVARLTQILANLLHNASKYSPEDTAISLQAQVAHGAVVVQVRDEGMGVDAELLPRIFDLFAQGKRGLDRSQGGLGVGLTLARRLAQLHGGDIEAFSEGRDKGSLFRVTLPGLLPAPAEIAASAPAALPVPGLGLQRILVVDDNDDAATAIAAVLEMAGHDIRVARDGQQALAQLADYQPAVVILDIGLPLLDGYEVARRMRKLPGGAQLLLIALTGYGQRSDRQSAVEAGFDFHFVKPAETELLLDCIRDWRGGAGRAGQDCV